MAGRRNSAYRLFAPPPALSDADAYGGDEFDESDIWGVETRQAEPGGSFRKPISSSAAAAGHRGGGGAGAVGKKKGGGASDRVTGKSAPMSIPDWSKILGIGYGSRSKECGSFYEEEEDDEATAQGPVIPPHEFLWKSRVASLSVHEGIGRTLKGRDLSRVRDAIWAKTGFEE